MNLPLPKKGEHPLLKKSAKNNDRMTPDEVIKFMKKHGVNEIEMALLFGVSVQGVKYWIDGQREVTVTVSKLIRLFNKYPQLMKEF